MTERYIHIVSFLFLSIAIFAGCDKTGGAQTDDTDPDAAYSDLGKVTYSPTDELFPNPERGFFTHLEISSDGSLSPISKTMLEGERFLNRSLVYTIYYMPDFISSPISDEYLALIQQNMDTLRENGFKCVLRFAYKRSYTEADHPWDAAEDIVHQHIAQLKPVLQENADVILCLEAGFIGTFGEWYYTDNFGFNPKTTEDYASRKRLVDALLDALPEERQVLVRYPAAKMGMYGITAADSITVATAHDGSDLSRIGAHNDCFVSSANDVGTYDSTEDREYVYTESRYTVWGGETCAVTAYCDCSRALPKCEDHHMTYLNNSYHQGVIARWREQDCYDEIDRRMGYRLQLDRAFFGQAPAAGEPFRVVLKIRNVGFAAPMNPRDAELVLLSSSGDEYVFDLEDVDPRFWFENMESTVDTEIRIPADIKKGKYGLYLNLPDGMPSLHDNPDYSIRLANEDLWDGEKGYNKLRDITIE